jgi:hypothetical protein
MDLITFKIKTWFWSYFFNIHNIFQMWANTPFSTVDTASKILVYFGFSSQNKLILWMLCCLWTLCWHSSIGCYFIVYDVKTVSCWNKANSGNCISGPKLTMGIVGVSQVYIWFGNLNLISKKWNPIQMC